MSGMNFYRLMKQGEAVLLFPGGVREAFKRRNEKYELFWPTQPEFVRMAIKHDAIIVPFAAVGAEDSFDIVADARDLLNNPLFAQTCASGRQRCRAREPLTRVSRMAKKATKSCSSNRSSRRRRPNGFTFDS